MERAGFDSTHSIRQPKALSASEFRRISDLMHQRFGIDLRQGKEGLVAARLGKKLREGGFSSFSSYFEHVLGDAGGDALVDMVDALTTNHTAFLRERAHFDFLAETIFPSLPPGAPIKIWSAACSTGEEPYSIACTLLALSPGSPPRIEILATDLSTRALKKARLGVYPAERLREFPPLWRQRFLMKDGADGSLRVRPEVVSRIEFRQINLMEPFRHGRRFHVIFCRNVMIYFDRRTQTDLVGRLSACLEPGGYLFVGHSESLTGVEHPLRYIRPAVYRAGQGLFGSRT